MSASLEELEARIKTLEANVKVTRVPEPDSIKFVSVAVAVGFTAAAAYTVYSSFFKSAPAAE